MAAAELTILHIWEGVRATTSIKAGEVLQLVLIVNLTYIATATAQQLSRGRVANTTLQPPIITPRMLSQVLNSTG